MLDAHQLLGTQIAAGVCLLIFGALLFNLLRLRGQMQAAESTTRIVPIPPATTEMTGPKSCAVTPDSKPPSSFDEPMNMEFTAETRPRISSGVMT